MVGGGYLPRLPGKVGPNQDGMVGPTSGETQDGVFGREEMIRGQLPWGAHIPWKWVGRAVTVHPLTHLRSHFT